MNYDIQFDAHFICNDMHLNNDMHFLHYDTHHINYIMIHIFTSCCIKAGRYTNFGDGTVFYKISRYE